MNLASLYSSDKQKHKEDWKKKKRQKHKQKKPLLRSETKSVLLFVVPSKAAHSEKAVVDCQKLTVGERSTQSSAASAALPRAAQLLSEAERTREKS